MKKMKRLVAILLAGVLALAMLTACGEESGGSKSFAQQVEEAAIRSYNASVSENSQLSNDSALRNRAMAMLNKIDENGMIGSDDALVFEAAADSGVGTVTVILAGNLGVDPVDNKIPAIEITAAELEKMNNAKGTETDTNRYGEVKAIGVAAKTINGKTYIAYGMTYSDSAK